MKLIALAAATLVIGGPAVAQDMSQQDNTMPAAVQGQSTDDPIGGYQPVGAEVNVPPPAGARVMFVPNPMTPSQAFPPPQPMKDYPICKAGQTDNCLQRSSARARRPR